MHKFLNNVLKIVSNNRNFFYNIKLKMFLSIFDKSKGEAKKVL